MEITSILEFEILFEDEFFVAINKPAGVLVHRSPMSRDKVFILQALSEQIGQKIYPIHRLDRPTSGVLLFAKSGEYAGLVQKQIQLCKVQKKYMALVRGWFDFELALNKSNTIVENDYLVCSSPLNKIDSRGNVVEEQQEAETWFSCLRKIEIPLEYRGFDSIRYSLMSVIPQTGRTHQIRRHLAHLRNPIVGDTRYGDLSHNKIFRERLDFNRLWLHSNYFQFSHPQNGTKIKLLCNLSNEMQLFLNSIKINKVTT